MYFLCFLTFCSACTSTKPYYVKNQRTWKNSSPPDTASLKYTVYLIGDVGNPEKDTQEPTLKLLQNQLFNKDATDTTNRSKPEDAIIFLGDNIYETGMPDSSATDRKEKERRISEQMKIVKEFRGRKIFIPGNHDWNKSHTGGSVTLKREEDFVENYLGKESFLPQNGCPGPVEVQMNKDLVIILLDSEWWLHKFDKPQGSDDGCAAGNRYEVIKQVEEIVNRNRGKNIVLAQHHPLFSNGRHGGHYSLRDYIFPLTLVRDNLWIPLPVIGSIYPLLRQYGVSRQDLSNKDYQQLRRGLLSVLQNEKNVVIAAGHEHALQFNKYKNLNHIISGAGSKRTSLIKGNDAWFTHGTKGFARLNYYTNGQCWVEFWEPEGKGEKGTLVYRTPLYAIPPSTKAQIAEEKQINYKDSTKVISASNEYKAGKLKRFFLGEHYRDTWSTQIKVPFLDLSSFAGGLTSVQLGGGHQTTSLEFKGKDGLTYTFRNVEKDPSKIISEGLRKTFAEDIFQDQISTAHPYSGVMVPRLAEAVGVYHPKPKLVYMPNSTLLGPYIQQIGGRLGFIEAKPDEDVSLVNSFGNAKNAVSTKKLYEKLRDDNDNRVDQEMFLKARLLDMLIGDWDRHENQWRWAEFKKDKGSLYRPIARDRDQAFPKYDGILPWLASKVVKFESFGYKIKSPKSLSFEARNLDRNFLNELTEVDWIRILNEMKKNLSDGVIESAIRQMPPETFSKSGDILIKKLKSRRDALPATAREYYRELSKNISIAGSDKKEFFKIERLEKETIVRLFKITDAGIDTKVYERIFQNNETSEINIYALNGKDSIRIMGISNFSPIKVRIIGGKGNDVISNNSESGKTVLYDTKEGNQIAGNVVLHLSNHADVTDYKPNTYHYNLTGFKPAVDFNGDDGLFLGGGIGTKHYSFKREPAYQQSLIGDYAFKSGAYGIRYSGTFFSVFSRKTDILINAGYNGPKYTFNYYGEGNSTPNLDDPNLYYRIRTKNLGVTAFIQHRYTKVFSVGIGPGFEYYRVEQPSDRFVGSPQFPDKEEASAPARFGTIRSFTSVNFVDNLMFPTSGVRWRNEANYFSEFSNTNYNFLHLRSTVSFYATPNILLPLTTAFRFGAATNIGEYKFFQGNSLGGNTFLRGYRNNRFTGRSILFHNTEVRVKVTNLRNYFLSGNLGVFGFFDTGRVFSDNIEKNTWHTGYGPGIWIKFYNLFLVSSSYGFSKEGQNINVKTGISF